MKKAILRFDDAQKPIWCLALEVIWGWNRVKISFRVFVTFCFTQPMFRYMLFATKRNIT